MTIEERAAYVAGIADLSDVASRCAEALRAKLVEAPTRFNFAVEALDAIAEAGRNLIADLPCQAGHLTARARVPRF